MKRLLSIILWAALASAMTSCASSRYISKSSIDPETGFALIEPFTWIEYMDSDRNTTYDDSLSWTCSRIITEEIIASGLPLNQLIELNFDSNESYIDAITSIKGIQTKKAGRYPIPIELDRLLEENGQRYGIVVFAEGFSRDSKGYMKDVLLGVAITAVTMLVSFGTVAVTNIPYKSALDMYLAVIDSQENCIVYYKCRAGEDLEPTRRSNVGEMVERLVRPFRKRL